LLQLGYSQAELEGLELDPAFLRESRDPATLEKLGDKLEDFEHQTAWHVVEVYAHDASVEIDPRPSKDYVVEHGSGIKKGGGPVEGRGHASYGHFDIHDGISKVVYTQADYEKLRKPKDGQWAWDPRHELSTLLVEDPLTDAPDAYGSYFVFRKYSQDVKVYEDTLKAIADEIDKRRKSFEESKDHEGVLPPDQRFGAFGGKKDEALTELIKQWIFGRGTDGETQLKDSAGAPISHNNFNFESDKDGGACPFHAHIRKMNPRGQTGNPELEKQKTIARRGTSLVATQVPVPNTQTTETRDAKGLLFWCAQASIEDQFEYIQEKWANSFNVPVELEPTPDVDTVIGVIDKKLTDDKDPKSHWRRWKETSDIDYGIWKAIKLVGAEYFYAPSLDGFDALKVRATGGQS
jgi:hypothetical protein